MSQRLNYIELAPDAFAGMRSVEHYLNAASSLEANLLELVRLRASLLNGCEYCIGLHTHELTRHNEPESRIASVASWRDSGAYTQRERAALAWAEEITNIQAEHASEDAFTAVRLHFPDKELVDLTVAIASINAWNRMAIAFRAERRSAPADPALAEDDGGKVSVEEEG